jgi:hypothetical protein
MAVRVDFIFQNHLIRHYVCANCWGRLHKERTEDRVQSGEWIYELVTCDTEGCPCNGFVSKSHVERAEVLARLERQKVWHDLKDLPDETLAWVREKGPDKRYEGRWDPEKEIPIFTGEEERRMRNSDILDELGF